MDKYGIQDKHSGSAKFVYFADPGSGAFLTPGFGMDEKSGSGSGIRNEKPGSYILQLKTIFRVKILKFFDPLFWIFPDSVGDPGCLSRIRLTSNPDLRSRVKKIPDPGSGLASKNLCFFTPKNCFHALGNMIITDLDLDFYTSRIPVPEVKKLPILDPGLD
jgi:hypothetical protein